MKTVVHELPPNAGRMIESLRDAGYDFETAVADIVDNSISAHATKVAISATCSQKNGNIRIIIADNGDGMSLNELCNAMTYGSDERAERHSLGKFGLGLKTASTSQCRKLSVVSRKSGKVRPSKLVLDIDHTAETNKWEYLEIEPKPDDIRYLQNVAPGHSGTVVKWKKCDRILTRKFISGGNAQMKAFEQKLADLTFHLAIVFQRFLDKDDDRAPNVEITLNGKAIPPWDPFCRAITSTELVRDQPVAIHDDFSDKDVILHTAAYVVPSRDELNAAEESLVFPPGISPDKLQGIYVYRENRLIHWGDWCRLAKSEFHQRLCRIEISFSEELDDCFQVDFKKSKINIDPEIAGWLKRNIIDPARSAADKRYRGSETSAATRAAKAVHQKSNNNIAKRAAETRPYLVKNRDDHKLEVVNAKGQTFVEKGSVEETERGMAILPVPELEDDLLWAPALFRDEAGRMATRVKINVSHPYYQKAYKACKGNDESIKALDYLLWSLANAEFGTKDEESAENYEDMRQMVSHSLRKLADSMPF